MKSKPKRRDEILMVMPGKRGAPKRLFINGTEIFGARSIAACSDPIPVSLSARGKVEYVLGPVTVTIEIHNPSARAVRRAPPRRKKS